MRGCNLSRSVLFDGILAGPVLVVIIIIIIIASLVSVFMATHAGGFLEGPLRRTVGHHTALETACQGPHLTQIRCIRTIPQRRGRRRCNPTWY